MKKNNAIAVLVFILISVVYCLPVLRNMSFLGQMDWDQFTFWSAVPRETILKYHQFPLWNPYANGGNVLLAHPHSCFLSPLYITVLLFGPIIGLKLQIIIHLIFGLLGMFLLAQYMKLTKSASYLASFVFMLNSMYAVHLSDGHANWLLLAFFPWVFLCYLKSWENSEYAIGSIFSLGMIIFGGDVDIIFILVAFCLIYSLFKWVQLKRIAPVKMLIIIFLGTFLLCSIKLIPSFEFLRHYPRLTDESTGVSLSALYKILLSRNQAFSHIESWQISLGLGLKYGWHEYSAYIGIVPLLLFVCGAITQFKERWPLLLTGLIFLFIALGNKTPVNLWYVLHSLPFYNSLHVPSRFLLGFVFSVSILAGFGLSFVEKIVFAINKKVNRVGILSYVILLFVLFDLWQVNSPIFKDVFIIPPILVNRNAAFAQRYKKVNWLGEEVSYSSMYPIFLSNSGVLEAYEIMNVRKSGVRAVSEPDYRGEVYLARSKGNIIMEYFSPNRIVLDVQTEVGDHLVLNQNYYSGWKVKNDGKLMPAEPFNGLISSRIGPGRHTIIFYFMPLSFLIGLCITIGFILSVTIFYVGKSRSNRLTGIIKNQ